jgi:hypothetical protein
MPTYGSCGSWLHGVSCWANLNFIPFFSIFPEQFFLGKKKREQFPQLMREQNVSQPNRALSKK